MQQTNSVRLQKAGSMKGVKTMTGRGAFTLTELLVVIAITAILMGLLFIPIIGGLQATRRAQGQSTAQSSVRNRMERITREIAQAAYVFDNTSTPITLPLQDPNGTFRDNLDGIIGIVGKVGPGGTPSTIELTSTGRTNLLYGKLDILPVATQGVNGTDLVDPTTKGGKLGGSMIRLPLAPGTKIVRYFLGINKNYIWKDANNNGIEDSNDTYTPSYYQNRYEFPKYDTEFNPFILYRVEFDPYDPNLIRPIDTDGDGKPDSPDWSLVADALNDPNFFYNLNSASTDIYWPKNSVNNGALRQSANKKPYATNWKARASVVLDGEKLDLLLWRHKRRGDINEGNPFGTAVNFLPGSIAGEFSTPDTLSSPGAETPKSIPTSYRTQYGHWTLPFTVTFQRGAGDGNADGELAVEFFNQPTGGGNAALMTRVLRNTGTLALNYGAGNNNFYVGYLPQSNKYFVKTNNLAYSIDPMRGKVETAFPSLAANNFVPFMTNGVTVGAMAAGNPAGADPYANTGELVSTFFQANTRDNQAGVGTVFINKGIESVNLLTPNDPTHITGGYFYQSGATTVSSFSPLAGFGNVLVVPGSEQVVGPDLVVTPNSPSGTSLVPYHRAATNLGSVQKPAGVDATLGRYLNRSGELDYRLDDDKFPLLGRLVFDEDQGDPNATLAGLPAKAAADPGAESIVQVQYLWQNNYARDAVGNPVNANGVALNTDIGGKPDGDTVRVDYSTRALLNVNFGARVYVSDGAEPQTVQVSEKVKINNLGR